LDLRRLNGRTLPPREQLPVRTAQPTQDMAHLRRLTGEQLARATLAAPAASLRLRSLETLPWAGASRSFLPEDNLKGEKLHQLVERLSARLGDGEVLLAQAQDDHRPERMQLWLPARQQVAALARTLRHETTARTSSRIRRKAAMEPWKTGDCLYPTWLLPAPLQLEVHRNTPHYHGPLRLLTRAHRIEAAWWDAHDQGMALRDYFIARSEEAGLLWIYNERPPSPGQGEAAQARWFLQGLYA
jgi:protein ImuB